MHSSPSGRPAGEAAAPDDARLAALRDYVDVTADPPRELQAVVRLATRVTGLPHAVVNVIDEHLQRQLAAEGFERSECAREDSMCAVSIGVGGLVHAPDASRDVRFAANPWVDGRMAQVRAYAAAPLLTPEGLALGTLCAFGPEPATLDARRRADLADLADLVVSIFDRERRARRQAQDREAVEHARRAAETARALQAGLLPGALPRDEAVLLTARYLPGTDGAEVGGDFYDAVRTERTLVLVMGDVQGHSTAAAALMGQVRTAVRAYVSEGHEPSAVLQRTNDLLCSAGTELFATCCLLALDTDTGEATVASAGHPAPVAFAPDPPRALRVEPGPPLGVVPGATYPAARHRFPGRSRLLLHTDGVVEWPRGGRTDGVAVLERVLREHAAADPDHLADALLAPAAGARADDAALLLADYAGPAPGSRESQLALPGDTRAVAAAREHLRVTLDAWGLVRVADEAELVVSELVTNAVLHTGSGTALTVRHDPLSACLALGVDDCSTSHPLPRGAGEDSLSGRGMQIVEVLAERWWVSAHGDGKTVWAELRVA
ncbi:SpoIIE family protein phosphatase [Paenibacillus sp. TRM 82003]|uniref:ATP-binding SpoIIE family protein phosphatase n=1 Tax=Kineococcus sp. TRM81007 TaxID=2925831 RepID=UPI001F56017A|nr:SpoIIE family protein phosphatase [Kineococcus sp. TRM81007]MCI2238496.1 SpoIIE family protein phosphatase [Kineococcus sp. TRM81007]MCI3921991.1 SpoIIE family protein phosphatase [Paenibacillus sp. TRM 82003]